jgi:hypothetical protein
VLPDRFRSIVGRMVVEIGGTVGDATGTVVMIGDAKGDAMRGTLGGTVGGTAVIE